ncbi:hypothetical protein AMECASPLE_021426 [Ameca splendens]|uniref:Uncharacterized protein n=1 Tax=Ameca splendens TaxID=208324 RepID=A0ABV0XSE9_9TELE
MFPVSPTSLLANFKQDFVKLSFNNSLHKCQKCRQVQTGSQKCFIKRTWARFRRQSWMWHGQAWHSKQYTPAWSKQIGKVDIGHGTRGNSETDGHGGGELNEADYGLTVAGSGNRNMTGAKDQRKILHQNAQNTKQVRNKT